MKCTFLDLQTEPRYSPTKKIQAVKKDLSFVIKSASSHRPAAAVEVVGCPSIKTVLTHSSSHVDQPFNGRVCVCVHSVLNQECSQCSNLSPFADCWMGQNWSGQLASWMDAGQL